MPGIKKRRLHVWESPALHPSMKKVHPVHVVFNDQEYDWWRVTPHGNVEVGWTIERLPDAATGQPASLEWKVFYTIAAGMFAKVNEEWYVEEPEDDRGSAALGRARNEEADEPHVATVDLPARTRFESFNHSGNPDESLPAQEEDESSDEVVLTSHIQPDSTIIMEPVRPHIDEATGVDVGRIHEMVNSKPTSPAPTMLLAPVGEVVSDNRGERSAMDLAATRLDLTVPLR